MSHFIGRVAGKATDRMLDVVDVDAVLDQVDIDALLARVDINALLDRVDIGMLLDRIDPNELLNRVDPNDLLDRVDVNEVAARLDLDALLARVDVQALVSRSGLPEIIADSTSQIAVSGLDLARRQIVGVDAVVGRIVDRILQRDTSVELVPEKLVKQESEGGPRSMTGHYAGAVARGLAAAADIALILTSFTLGLAAVDFLLAIITGWQLDDTGGLWWTIALLSWAFLYWFVSEAVAGRTIGKAVLGQRVVQKDGSPLGAQRAFWRTAFIPLGFVTFGITYLPILLQREHRAVHDWIAGTAVVIDWGDRVAEMPAPLAAFLARHEAG